VYIDLADEEAAVAAVKALHLAAISRQIRTIDLERLARPAILVLEEGRRDGMEAAQLARLRRDYVGGIRYSPVVAVCQDKTTIEDWRLAGASPILVGAKRARFLSALKAAIDGRNHWVVSTVYVGPCRRRHNALMSLKRRRRADRPGKRQLQPEQGARVTATAPAATLLSRLRVASVCISGAPIEQREHFVNLARELASAVARSDHPELLADATALVDEARALARDMRRDSGKALTLIETMSSAV
jgi:hypothetical protein